MESERTILHIPFASILGILFIALKLTGYIDWSWWWVLSPFWIPVIVILVVVIFGAIAQYIVVKTRENSK